MTGRRAASHDGALRVLIAIRWLACAALIPLGGAAAEIQRPEWQKSRVALDRCLTREEFRIYYALGGPDAILGEGRADTDGDGVPDKIQNLALQLVAARRMYIEVMGLRHPFQSPRYRGRVKYFDVHVRGMKNRGIAGDAIVNFHRPTDPPEGLEVLSIDIDKNIGARNLTPAHELFHEFQNGYTLFKNAWYTEGTARWSESAFQTGVGRAESKPTTQADVERLFALSYAADGFWNALAQVADPKGALALPDSLKAMRYLGDPKPIIEDDRLHGVAFIRTLLEELDREDDIASREAGLDPLDWPEARQRSPENNPYIWRAVAEVCRRLKIEPPGPPLE